MFGLPASTLVNRRIPKTKFYEKLQADHQLRELFTRQIDTIVWKHKLSRETIHLAPGGDVEEIQIFEIHLKEPSCSHDLLRSIDRAIPYPILHVLVYGDQVKLAIAHKERNRTDENRAVVHAYYETDWQPADRIQLNFLQAVDLKAVYENMIRQLLPHKTRLETDLAAALERQARIDRLKKEYERLESKIIKEKQFHIKVELNRELQRKKKELQELLDEGSEE